jgi:hypothetical protein
MATDFVDDDLSGQIAGRDWKYRYAYINPAIQTPEEDDVVFVFLPFKPKDPCPRSTEGAKDSRQIYVAAPKGTKLTKIKAGTPRNWTFQYVKKGEAFATSAKVGKIKLTSISGNEVKGKLFAQLNASHWVSGTFTAVVCNSMDFR